MMKKIILSILFLCQLFIAPTVWAIEKAEASAILSSLFNQKVEVNQLRETPMKGVYEVTVGREVAYISEDGRFVFAGNMFDAKSQRNLTQETIEGFLHEAGKKLLAQLDKEIGADKMIVIGPKKPKRIMNVFTDVDCPYCARLHRDVPELNANGVQVRYLLFPRTGLGSRSYQRSVAVWCAKDRAEAIGVAKFGGDLEMKTCENPVSQHYHLGKESGVVGGTPTTVLDDGSVISGYMPIDKLLVRLGIKKPEPVKPKKK